TQTFSLPKVDISLLERVCASHGLTLHWAIPHGKKLKRGHLLGNRFTITLLHPTPSQALPQAQAIIAALQQRGLPNYFGSQRFGQFGDNAEQGLAILTGQRPRPRARWLYNLLTSAYQSQLFNQYLAQRIEHGHFQYLWLGDLAKKTDTGGMFLVEDLASEQERFERGEITFTGPLFGYKMRQPDADAAAFEADILATSAVTAAQWRQHRVTGNRRVGRVFLDPISIEPHPSGFTLQFYLPKGAYATVLLREIIKSDSNKQIL
ncbi:MAG: tRNA pseudouridine(13) synthase TruD, partial [Chloroflexi bacterium]|nr:tRNA pseudouridine(13) synthase TruD [Chloroflexota bacterium]